MRAAAHRIIRLTFAFLAAATLHVAMAGAVRAVGLIIIVDNPDRAPGHFAFAPLEISKYRASVEIDDNVATTSVDQEFYNPGSARTEGTYLFPIPEGAHIDKFSMDVNGQQMEAELLSAEKAKSIYEDIVRKQRDPGLLEYCGQGAFRVRIFPIEPRSTKRVQIKYTQLLKEDAGVMEYAYPLNTEKFSAKLIPQVSLSVHVKSAQPLKTIFCPTHEAQTTRNGEAEATAVLNMPNSRPDRDFKLLITRQKKDVDLKLLTYRKPGSDDGFFMLLASPGWNGAERKDENLPAGKDIVFVLDTSGSMADGGKLDQAKKALGYCLANLNAEDRFDIVRFSTEAEAIFPTLQPATSDNVKAGRDRIDAFKPSGGTAIDDALQAALKLRTSAPQGVAGRPFMLVFLTDGLPTIGTSSEEELVKHATDRSANTRIFCFGLGSDVNTHLLDRIADATRAASQYVSPSEDLELKLASFYDKIKEPAMTDLKVAFGGEGISTSQLYPSALPDLFKGQTLLVLGKFKGAGPGSAKLTGSIGGQQREFAEDVSFARDDMSRAFIPVMWATRRVGWLLDEIRQRGESAEVKDEIVKLSREYAIVTPYTAYLITEDETRRNVPIARRALQDFEKDRVTAEGAKAQYDSAGREARDQMARSGEQAVANATAMNQLKYNQASVDPQAQQGLATPATSPTAGVGGGEGFNGQLGYRVAQNYAQQMKVVNGRTFFQNGSTWSDGTAQARNDLKQVNVKFASDDYYALLNTHPAAAQWLALGNNIDLVLDDTLYLVRGE